MKDIEHISFPLLFELYCEKCEICSIENIHQMNLPQLKILKLGWNWIISINSITKCYLNKFECLELGMDSFIEEANPVSNP